MKVSFFILACIGFLAASAVAGVSVPKIQWITPAQQACLENKANKASTEVAAQFARCAKLSALSNMLCITYIPVVKSCQLNEAPFPTM